MVTKENYEEYLILQADGELSPHEEQELLAFLDRNPQLKSEMATYESARLLPDLSIQYGNKKALIKPESGTRFIGLINWRSYGIAAGIALLIIISGLVFNKAGKNGTDNNNTALNNPIENHANPIAPQITTLSPSVTPSPHTPQKTIARVPGSATGIQKVNPVQNNIYAATVPSKTPKHLHKEPVNNYLPQHGREVMDAVSSLPVAVLNEMPLRETKDKNLSIPPINTSLPQFAAVAENTGNKRSFIEKLPVDDVKKQGLEKLANSIGNTLDQIGSIKQEIKDNSITLEIRNRKLVISF